MRAAAGVLGEEDGVDTEVNEEVHCAPVVNHKKRPMERAIHKAIAYDPARSQECRTASEKAELRFVHRARCARGRARQRGIRGERREECQELAGTSQDKK